MWVVPAQFSLFFIILGLVFIQGKGAFLIAGYNTSSRAEKKKYDENALCRFMGKIMFLFAACLLIAVLGETRYPGPLCTETGKEQCHVSIYRPIYVQ